MKKILGLTIAALLVMALVGGGTWAYFSDPETSTANILGAGTLDLTLAGGTQSIDSVTGTWTSPSSWAPGGATATGTLTLDNVGTIDMTTITLTVSNSDDGGANMSPYTDASSEPEYMAESGTYTGGTPNDDNTPIDDVSTMIDITILTYNGVDLIDQAVAGTFDDATLQAADVAGNDDDIIQLGELATVSNWNLIAAAGLTELAGDGVGVTTHALVMTIQLNTGADNEYQGDVSTMTMTLTGQQ